MKYQDLSIEEKTKLTKAGRRNCQYNNYGMWTGCPSDIVFFNPLQEYRIKPEDVPALAEDLPVQSHKAWLQDRATILVTEVLRLVKLGEIDEVSIEYCTQLIAILVELKEMNDA